MTTACIVLKQGRLAHIIKCSCELLTLQATDHARDPNRLTSEVEIISLVAHK